ncbi:hypothetical protein E1B28_006837 [Marasmius oreades]|uniref:Uncharacterized protein n=1 Tax=Marasmius oreades TaxID=181124 RepID=A0A9P8AAX5_9AGAR|nr:uncharacterized protein E1B28_006837 [Marasmius oreades]KAG7096164.1 hypothetical protein E1B28_006837 [Marasmius oreades]
MVAARKTEQGFQEEKEAIVKPKVAIGLLMRGFTKSTQRYPCGVLHKERFLYGAPIARSIIKAHC